MHREIGRTKGGKRVDPGGGAGTRRGSALSLFLPIHRAQRPMTTAYGPSDQAATKASLKSWWERFKTNPNRTAKDDDKECEYMLAGWACAATLARSHYSPQRVRRAVARVAQVCQRPHINCQCKWRTVHLGIYSSCCCQMVSVLVAVWTRRRRARLSGSWCFTLGGSWYSC